MNRVNPKYILRNHLAETAIRQARGDDGPRDFARSTACSTACGVRTTSNRSTRPMPPCRRTGPVRCICHARRELGTIAMPVICASIGASKEWTTHG
jgi:uncharacterized protein YdiU (UPF0061 family)